MNQLAHVFITYFILSFIIPDTQTYLLPIALFAIILDFDHVPGYFKLLLTSKKDKAKLKIKDYINLFRTAIQEPIGIITIELVFLILYLYGIKSSLLLIASLSIAFHWLIDFLTVHTRPFDPLDKRVISLFFHSKKQRITSEIIITLISAIFFLIVYY
jgi:hypothetical protein